MLGLAVTWIGLGVAYYSPYPIGFWITTLSFGAYVGAAIATRQRRSSRRLVGTPA